MKIGDTVEMIQPVIKGQILDTQYNKDLLCLEHLMRYTDSDSHEQMRWFPETQLKAAV